MDAETFDLFRTTVRRFVSEKLIPAEDAVEEADAVPETMIQQMRDMGLDEDSIREARDSLLSPDEVAHARRRPETLDQPDHQDHGQTPEAEKKPNE